MIKLPIQAFVEYLPVILISVVLIYLLIFTAKKIMGKTDEDYFEDTIYKYTLIFTTIFTFCLIYFNLKGEVTEESGFFIIDGYTNWDIVRTIVGVFIFFSFILMILLKVIIKNLNIKEKPKTDIKFFYVIAILFCTSLFFEMKDEIVKKVDVLNKYIMIAPNSKE